MPLTRGQLDALQLECMADDVEYNYDVMRHLTEQEACQFFESGGAMELPTQPLELVCCPRCTLHNAACSLACEMCGFDLRGVNGGAGAGGSPLSSTLPAASPPTAPLEEAACPACTFLNQPGAASCEMCGGVMPGHGGGAPDATPSHRNLEDEEPPPSWRRGPPATAAPLLTDVSPDERHVQTPSEQVEEWMALASGGFERAPMRLHEALAEAGLARHAPALAAVTLRQCLDTLDKSRTSLLALLKEAGVANLAERQTIANALSKARREGRLN